MEAREKAEKFEKNAKFFLTKKAECSILTWCVNAHVAMKREIADASPVTSVEYVRTGFGRLCFRRCGPGARSGQPTFVGFPCGVA